MALACRYRGLVGQFRDFNPKQILAFYARPIEVLFLEEVTNVIVQFTVLELADVATETPCKEYAKHLFVCLTRAHVLAGLLKLCEISQYDFWVKGF